MTQEELAGVCGISTRYINKILNRKASPTISTLEKICVSWKVDPNELLLDGQTYPVKKSNERAVLNDVL